MALKTLSADLDIVQKLVIPGLDSDLDVIQKLDDEPNDVGGLTAAQLKAKFDESGNIVKKYLNETLLPAISETVVEAEVRAEAEAEREAAEEARETAEAARAAAELERQAAEEAREAAEAARRAAELERAEAERLRAQAEADREAAEAARRAAEAGRVDETAGVVALAREQAAAAQAARGSAQSAADRAEAAASRAQAVTGGPFAPLDGEGKVPDPYIGDNIPRLRVIASRLRDPSKPDYGLGGGGGAELVLELEGYTGKAALSAVLSGREYDALNLGTSGEAIPDGTIMIRKEE